MFWRFGFANASSLDSLLSNPSVSLESILDEDDLLQECKAQNTRLIDYFSRADVLKRLFGYVTRTIDCDDPGMFKYPYVATEVLCSEIWSIVETSLGSPNHILLPFWDNVLDRTTEDMKTEMVLASHFAKINLCFLNKKPEEMLAFIQSIPSVLDKLLSHIESPSIVDILLRLIQIDDSNWLSTEHLIQKLLNLLSPQYPPDVHTIVSDLLKTIISLSSPSPSSAQNDTGIPPSNVFARQLASRGSIQVFATYILWDFGPNHNVSSSEGDNLPSLENCASSVTSSISLLVELIRKNNSDFFEPYLFHLLRHHLTPIVGDSDSDRRAKMEQTMTELTDCVGLVNLGPLLEVAKECLPQLKDYLLVPRSLTGPIRTTTGPLTPLTFERYRIVEFFAELLHCSNMSFLNRSPDYDDLYDEQGRLCGGLEGLEKLGTAVETGNAIVNHRLSSVGSGSRYGDDDRDLDTDVARDDSDSDGLVDHTVDFPVSKRRPQPDVDDYMDDQTSSDDDDAMEEIVMNEDLEASPSPVESLDALGGSNQGIFTQSSSPSLSPLPDRSIDSFPSPKTSAGSLGKKHLRSSSNFDGSSSSLFLPSQNDASFSGKDHALPSPWRMPLGEKLKQKFLDIGILQVLLDLFFKHPWNNFLHVSVYDVIHQILTGPVELPASSPSSSQINDSGGGGSNRINMNRALAISLFRDVKLMKRIVEGQRMNDEAIKQPKASRLGYMGHLTMIASDVLMVLERFPAELRNIIMDGMSSEEKNEWDEYVKAWKEARKRDESLLGGGKPILSSAVPTSANKWKVDETELTPSSNSSSIASSPFKQPGEPNGMDTGKLALAPPNEMKGVFHRSTNGKSRREGSADFGVVQMVGEEEEEEEEEEDKSSALEEKQGGKNVSHFARYLAPEVGSSQLATTSSDDDDSDDDDYAPGWLSRSSNMASNAHSLDSRHPLGAGFGDSFSATPSSSSPPSGPTPSNPFGDDDDDFGAFSSGVQTENSSVDAFGLPSTPDSALSSSRLSSSFSTDDNMSMSDDGSFDFGDFQSAEKDEEDSSSGEEDVQSGQSTPTAGSWSFEDDFGVGVNSAGDEGARGRDG